MAPAREPATIELNKLTWFLPELRYSLTPSLTVTIIIPYGIFIARIGCLKAQIQCINSFLANDCLKAVGDAFVVSMHSLLDETVSNGVIHKSCAKAEVAPQIEARIAI